MPSGLTATREENTLAYTGATVIANGGTATMSAVLVEDGANDDDSDGGGPPIAGRTIHFTLGSGATAQTCDAVSNVMGVATCPISPVAQPLGPGTVTAEFAGDPYYQPSSDSASIILFAFLDSGSFAVGDLGAAVGSPATFWSSEWSEENALSGGTAPTAFKGFINGLAATPPACGASWTAQQGGNSVGPPTGPLPSYMGVVVTTAVTKSGSVSAGNISQIVVVQTNGEYAPAPGHVGTGPIVAKYCP